MSQLTKVLFIGAGGYAKSALDSLDRSRYEFCGFIDAFKDVGSSHLGYPVRYRDIGEVTDIGEFAYFVSIGDNQHRSLRYQAVKQAGGRVISIIDPSALVSVHAELGEGVFVGKMAIINSGACIGDNVIINTKALVEHGCCIDEHCNISTNSTLNGDVYAHAHAFIGSSSVINGQLSIGTHAVVGAGAVVIRNVEAHTTVAGVPARVIG